MKEKKGERKRRRRRTGRNFSPLFFFYDFDRFFSRRKSPEKETNSASFIFKQLIGVLKDYSNIHLNLVLRERKPSLLCRHALLWWLSWDIVVVFYHYSGTILCDAFPDIKETSDTDYQNDFTSERRSQNRYE